MKQEEKSLWLKDLCARVPYHPKGHIVNVFTGASYDEYLTCASFKDFAQVMNNCQLYLRPISSMTEEEEREVRILWNEDFYDKVSLYHCYPKTTDFYNSHHLDYRGLIEKGLAIAVTEENNPYKEE